MLYLYLVVNEANIAAVLQTKLFSSVTEKTGIVGGIFSLLLWTGRAE
jgi:hypothetical protein